MNNEAEIKAAHNAARVLQNMTGRGLSKTSKAECEEAARQIYAIFGEPDQPMTSAGGNYFEIMRKPE